MLKWIESTGKSEEAAVEAALRQLGLDRDDVSVEVLERAKSGFLGIGSCPAKVRVTYEVPGEASPPPPEPKAPESEAPESRTAEPPPGNGGERPSPLRREGRRSAPKRAETGKTKEKTQSAPPPAEAAPGQTEAPEDRTGAIEGFLAGLLARMGASASPAVRLDGGGGYQVDLVGENLGSLIGRRGETLDAIQQLTNYAVNRGQAKRVRIHVDAENYRAKREESLVRLARKVAGKVVKYRRNTTLEPMNAYERHVIHTALQDFPGVTTYSVGTEPNRRTVVAYSREERQQPETAPIHTSPDC